MHRASSRSMRPYIEVDTGRAAEGGTGSDPIELFAHMLRVQRGDAPEIEESNRKLLKALVHKEQIPRSSIVWHNNRVSRIYGLKLDSSGRVQYGSPAKGSPKRTPKAYVADVEPINLSVLRDAIVRSKQMAI